MIVDLSDYPVADLEHALARARNRERQAREAAAAAVEPIWQFTLTPKAQDRWNPLFDPTCALYRLEGQVTNVPELKAVGRMVPASGGADYVYNMLTHNFICRISGGVIFLDHSSGWSELSAFIKDNARGGDVTKIVRQYHGMPV